ncbi:MAG: hypothetical protein ACF8Q5_09425 [Phycisphaerales bacterium JB040]
MPDRTDDTFPRLAVDLDEPPAPLRFPGRDAGADTGSDRPDAIAMAQDALDRAQAAIDQLDELADDLVIPFPGRDAEGDPDDDGPRAA